MPVFTDQTILITGASAGIGRALAVALAPQRPKLALAARRADRLAVVADECRALGAEVLVVPTDVTQPDDCRQMVEQTVARFGRLDVLINNAGVGTWTRFDETRDLSIFEQSMRVNYLGAVYATWHALPHLKQSRGRLVAVSSMAGLMGVPMYTAYAATKHAQFGFFDSLRIELRGSGVTVTMIAPDYVASEIHGRALGSDGNPLGDSPRPEQRFMSAERCARLMVRAIERRRRRAVLSFRGRWIWLGKLLTPRLLDYLADRSTRQ
jgi:short-subunit dehydrogenase